MWMEIQETAGIVTHGWHLDTCQATTTFFFFFLGLYPQHMEVTMLGVESQLQLPAYATAYATATQDLSHITAMPDP